MIFCWPAAPARPATLEETLEWLRNNFSNRFTYRLTTAGDGASAREVRVSYEPILFQGCNLERRDGADTLSVSLSELDPQELRVEAHRAGRGKQGRGRDKGRMNAERGARN